jgi:hypothetical protein
VTYPVRCVVLGLLALLLTVGEGDAADHDKLVCLKKSRTDYGTCQREAQERCKTTFDQALRDCFGADNTCVRGCQADEGRCQVDPSANLEGCKIACGTDLKAALRDCKVQTDLKGCQATARAQSLKCRQKCTSAAQPAKQRCQDQVRNCLIGCAGGQ